MKTVLRNRRWNDTFFMDQKRSVGFAAASEMSLGNKSKFSNKSSATRLVQLKTR